MWQTHTAVRADDASYNDRTEHQKQDAGTTHTSCDVAETQWPQASLLVPVSGWDSQAPTGGKPRCGPIPGADNSAWAPVPSALCTRTDTHSCYHVSATGEWADSVAYPCRSWGSIAWGSKRVDRNQMVWAWDPWPLHWNLVAARIVYPDQHQVLHINVCSKVIFKVTYKIFSGKDRLSVCVCVCVISCLYIRWAYC